MYIKEGAEMMKHIKKFISQFNDQNLRFLCFELLLFSALYGIAFRSWAVWGVMLLGLVWLLGRTRGVAYMIYAMSLLWGFIAFSIGHSISWGWATALGMAFFLVGLGAHSTGLKKSVVRMFVSANHENNEWRRNCYDERHNLN